MYCGHTLTEDQERGTRARVDLRFLLRPPMLWPGLLISLATTLILVGGAVLHLVNFHPELGPASALLVALPGFLAGYALASEHRLTWKLSAGLRISTLGSAALSLIAAGSLAVHAPEPTQGAWRSGLWLVLAGLATLNSLGLAASLARSQRAERALRLEEATGVQESPRAGLYSYCGKRRKGPGDKARVWLDLKSERGLFGAFEIEFRPSQELG